MQILQKTINGYIYDRRIIYSGFLLVILLFIYIASLYDFDFEKKVYVKCDSDICPNELYTNSEVYKHCKEEWCNLKYFERGEYGTPYPYDDKLFNNFGLLSVSIMLCSLILNHFVHNKGKKPELLTNHIPKWLKDKINKFEFEQDED